jgi:hypothetical protein
MLSTTLGMQGMERSSRFSVAVCEEREGTVRYRIWCHSKYQVGNIIVWQMITYWSLAMPSDRPLKLIPLSPPGFYDPSRLHRCTYHGTGDEGEQK